MNTTTGDVYGKLPTTTTKISNRIDRTNDNNNNNLSNREYLNLNEHMKQKEGHYWRSCLYIIVIVLSALIYRCETYDTYVSMLILSAISRGLEVLLVITIIFYHRKIINYSSDPYYGNMNNASMNEVALRSDVISSDKHHRHHLQCIDSKRNNKYCEAKKEEDSDSDSDGEGGLMSSQSFLREFESSSLLADDTHTKDMTPIPKLILNRLRSISSSGASNGSQSTPTRILSCKSLKRPDKDAESHILGPYEELNIMIPSLSRSPTEVTSNEHRYYTAVMKTQDDERFSLGMNTIASPSPTLKGSSSFSSPNSVNSTRRIRMVKVTEDENPLRHQVTITTNSFSPQRTQSSTELKSDIVMHDDTFSL